MKKYNIEDLYLPNLYFLIFALLVLFIIAFTSFKEVKMKQENMIKCIEADKSEEFCLNAF